LSYFDDGLQPERTLLAWKRTILLTAVASAAVARFTVNEFGWMALVVGVVGLLASSISYFTVRHRYAKQNDSLLERNQLESGALPFALVAFVTLLLAAFALGYILELV